MIQIRQGVFETNSSSTHAISICEFHSNIELPEVVLFETNQDFGWEFEDYTDVYSKANYLWLAICYKYNNLGQEDELIKAKATISQYLQRIGVKAEFIQSDLFENVGGEYDVIVSNPPYIRSDVIETLMPEVKDHEPMKALDGTEDGLYFYREITRQAIEHLEEGGWLLYEIGHDQGEAVKTIMSELFSDVSVIKDLAGLDRVVVGCYRK